jgi:hypothetical protein
MSVVKRCQVAADNVEGTRKYTELANENQSLRQQATQVQ